MSDAIRISKMHAADPYCRGKGVLDCGGIRGSEVKRSQLRTRCEIVESGETGAGACESVKLTGGS